MNILHLASACLACIGLVLLGTAIREGSARVTTKRIAAQRHQGGGNGVGQDIAADLVGDAVEGVLS